MIRIVPSGDGFLSKEKGQVVLESTRLNAVADGVRKYLAGNWAKADVRVNIEPGIHGLIVEPDGAAHDVVCNHLRSWQIEKVA